MKNKKDLTLSVQYVKGIGPGRAAALAKREIRTVRDLLYYFPFDYLDLSITEKIGSLRLLIDSGKLITTIGKVRTFEITPEDAGLPRADGDALRGGDANANAERMRVRMTAHANARIGGAGGASRAPFDRAGVQDEPSRP